MRLKLLEGEKTKLVDGTKEHLMVIEDLKSKIESEKSRWVLYNLVKSSFYQHFYKYFTLWLQDIDLVFFEELKFFCLRKKYKLNFKQRFIGHRFFHIILKEVFSREKKVQKKGAFFM